MLLLDRHRPATLVRPLSSLHDRLHHLLVVAKQSRRVLSESHTDGSRQRRDVHHTLQLVLLLHVRHRVCEDQSSLRVRITHLHELPLPITLPPVAHVTRPDDRAWLVALVIHQILHRRNHAHHVHRRVHPRQRVHRAHHRRRAALVQLHVLDMPRRLQIHPARVETHALPHQRRELRLRVVAST